MYAEDWRDPADQQGRAPEVARIRSRLETFEPEAFVIALQLTPAGQVEHDSRLAREERLNDRVPDALALSSGHDRDRCQFTASVSVRLDLAHPDHLSVLLGHHEVRPTQVHAGQANLFDETEDSGLVGFGRGTGGSWHPGASRLSRGPPHPKPNDAARPQ